MAQEDEPAAISAPLIINLVGLPVILGIRPLSEPARLTFRTYFEVSTYGDTITA